MTSSQSPLLENATRDLACFAAELRYEDIPAEVVERMKTSLLDSIGCCLYGATLPWTQRLQDMVEAEQAAPMAGLWGSGKKTSIANAVLVNSTAGHAFELDDIHKESIVHAGSIAVPVALAYAEHDANWTGQDLIASLVAGYEVGTRVGNAATMSLFYRGFHPQGTSGTFVAVASAGKALGLDADRMQHALGIAGSQAGGLMAAQEGAMVKRFHAGRAAQSGVYSAELAKRDFTGIPDVLEARYGGYLTAYSDKPNAARLTDGLSTTWETAKVGYKPHASVTSIHSALDALKHIMRAQALKADDIALIRVGVSHMTYVHCAWEYKAQGVTAAQMNLYYGLAVIAHDGEAFVDQYDEKRLADPALLDLIKRTKAYEDAEIEAMGPPFRHAATVTVKTRDGREFTHRILNRRGSPENPISADDVEYKFRNVVRSCLPPQKIELLVELCKRLDTLSNLEELVSILSAPRA
ncbi:MmgE/PrpD family protein [Allopusillimonas ginsengisoli]|uniref:MmgE/PrpD family protein n=1 Tax=Allopusillimonas ginsengisoli TaxID=453575 RepID=UPI00102121EB|nr:MmgE/PrpD family protein [Allopusillimonas ginsengisoli]TEA79599.1 MmgE/PrpD family protein [Allopusillimonas ginsengisoli]